MSLHLDILHRCKPIQSNLYFFFPLLFLFLLLRPNVTISPSTPIVHKLIRFPRDAPLTNEQPEDLLADADVTITNIE